MRTKLLKVHQTNRNYNFTLLKLFVRGKFLFTSRRLQFFRWFSFELSEGRFDFMVIGFFLLRFLYVEEAFEFMCADLFISLSLCSLIIQGVKRFMALPNEHFLRFFNLYRWAGTHKLLSSDLVMCLVSQMRNVFSASRAILVINECKSLKRWPWFITRIFLSAYFMLSLIASLILTSSLLSLLGRNRGETSM